MTVTGSPRRDRLIDDLPATRLSQLLAQVERGEDVVIAPRRYPHRATRPSEPPAPRPMGFVAGSGPEAFFEPLSDEELAAWE